MKLILSLLAGAALFQSRPIASQSSVADKVKKLIAAVNVDDNPKLECPGEAFLNLTPESLPALKEAQKRKDLKWTARACIAKAIRKVDERAKGLSESLASMERRKEYDRLYLEEYKRASRRDAAWDAAALEAVEAAALAWQKGMAIPHLDDSYRAWDSSQAAIGSGCDDPLVLYVSSRMMLDKRVGSWEERADATEKAAKALDGSRYSPYLRFLGHWATADALVRVYPPGQEVPERAKQRIRDHAEAALRSFVEALQADSSLSSSLILDRARSIMDLFSKIDDRKKAFTPIHAALKQSRPKTCIPPLVAGAFWISYAWDARGRGWANDVPPEGWGSMQERLSEARKELTAAWKLEPSNVEPPLAMLRVALGDHDSNKDEMELWFSRAIEADPDSMAACNDKMYYLEPKWHGSPEEMIKFGRQCLLTGNWEGGIPFLLAEAHFKLSSYTPKGYKPEPDWHYFENADVWKDIKAVYEAYLKRTPEAIHYRASYAFLCWKTKRWKDANEQLNVLGDAPTVLGLFASLDQYARAKRESAEHANEK